MNALSIQVNICNESDPVKNFDKFIDNIVLHIVEETNRYARQCIEKNNLSTILRA